MLADHCITSHLLSVSSPPHGGDWISVECKNEEVVWRCIPFSFNWETTRRCRSEFTLVMLLRGPQIVPIAHSNDDEIYKNSHRLFLSHETIQHKHFHSIGIPATGLYTTQIKEDLHDLTLKHMKIMTNSCIQIRQLVQNWWAHSKTQRRHVHLHLHRCRLNRMAHSHRNMHTYPTTAAWPNGCYEPNHSHESMNTYPTTAALPNGRHESVHNHAKSTQLMHELMGDISWMHTKLFC